jgi:hypothetical protein
MTVRALARPIKRLEDLAKTAAEPSASGVTAQNYPDDGPDAFEAAMRLAIEIWNGRHEARRSHSRCRSRGAPFPGRERLSYTATDASEAQFKSSRPDFFPREALRPPC